jgi:DNA-binding NarL/FixJ family response regulator
VGGSPLRLLVVDDHPLFIEAVRLALEGADDFEIVGTAASGKELLELVRPLAPDVVLLDLRMPGIDGLTCLDRLRERRPCPKVIIVSALADPNIIAEALERGACGYVVKTVDPRDLAAALRLAIAESVFTHLGPAPPGPLDELSTKERTVLAALARGLTNKEIARDLSLSDQTVKFHLTNVYRKLGIRNRAEAARLGLSHGVGSERAEKG